MSTKRNTGPAAPSGTEPVVVTSIRMSPDQHTALKALAVSRHRTVSQELRVAIDHHLEEAA